MWVLQNPEPRAVNIRAAPVLTLQRSAGVEFFVYDRAITALCVDNGLVGFGDSSGRCGTWNMRTEEVKLRVVSLHSTPVRAFPRSQCTSLRSDVALLHCH